MFQVMNDEFFGLDTLLGIEYIDALCDGDAEKAQQLFYVQVALREENNV